MSRYFVSKYAALTPYTPGEQPRGRQYVKLNTNESPFPPSEGVIRAVEAEGHRLNLYSDPECFVLRGRLAARYGVEPDMVMLTNGSDDVLNFAFMAFSDEQSPLFFPDITYGFYPVFASLNHIPYTEIPLTDDFSIDPADYVGVNGTVVIANPNAPTGRFLPLDVIEAIVRSNPDHVVIVDEAYIDFGGQSAVSLVPGYDNLLVTQTFSKSRSMAGARLGFCIGQASLIADLNTLRYSTNPYNVNLMTAAAGVAALEDDDYYMGNCRVIMDNRAWTTSALEALGFTVLPSKANFVFARSDRIGGEELYLRLKEKGVLVRHFRPDRIKEYNRITIGTRAQMECLVDTVKEILKEAAV